MRSDGLFFPGKLQKYHCHSCGMLFLSPNSDFQSLLPYRRSDGTSLSDIKRHHKVSQGICKLIKEIFPYSQGISVLEIGAGNFLTSEYIAKLNPADFITAVEPSPENNNTRSSHNLNIIRGNLEDLRASDRFDIIFANHVLEHLPDLQSFVLHCRDQLLKDDGAIFFIVPSNYPASEEILFCDHLYTFTKKAMISFLDKTGIQLACSFESDWDPCSTVYVLTKANCTKQIPESFHTRMNTSRIHSSEKLKESRLIFSRKWNISPTDLINRLDSTKKSVFFGAGEYAQLLRCHFPELYEIVSFHVVSSTEGIRSFPKEVYELNEIDLTNKSVVLAVHPTASATVTELLAHHCCSDVIRPPTYD